MVDLEREAREFADLFGCEQPEPRNPRPVTPNTDPSLADAGFVPGDSLAERLGPMVDRLRTLHTTTGVRPYRMFSVVARWTGGEEGRGVEEVVRETEFLPRPFVDVRPLRSETTPAGRKDRGMVRIRELSPRYTEDEIRELVDPATDHRKGEFSFVELRIDSRDGVTERRRLTIADVPWRSGDGFEWVVDAYIQQRPRSRTGAFQGRTLYPGENG